MPDAVNKLGKPGVIAHGMAIASRNAHGSCSFEGKPIMILSGNPIAAVIGFEVFTRPLICRMLGMNKTEARPLLRRFRREEFQVRLAGKLTFESAC